MRLIILTFLSFLLSSNAHSMSVADAEKYCKSFSSNSFKIQTVDDLLCANTLKTITDMGYLNCVDLRKTIKRRGDSGAELEELTSLYSIMASFSNERVSIENAVRSFLVWSQQNPSLGKTSVVEHAYVYLAQPFPCKPDS